MTTDEMTTPSRWWSAENVEDLAADLARRQSRLWQHINPTDLAQWVFADPEPAPLDPAPAELGFDWRDGLNQQQQAVWALAGWFLRMTVPEVVATAGTHWLLSDRVERGRPLLRLTVGTLETFGIRLSGDGFWLRIDAEPAALAMEAGAADLTEWGRRGVEVLDDRTKTLVGEKWLLSCPDIDTVWWLLRQPPAMIGARMLSAWLAAGPFSFESKYRPEVAARAWLAAEALLNRKAH